MAEDTKKRDLRAGATPPGRVAKDRRGRTVWQWTEEESSGSTSVLLKFLDNEALSLEPTQAVPVPDGAGPRVTGGESTETTSAMLRRLAGDGLSLDATWRVRAAEADRDASLEPRRADRDPGDDDAPEADAGTDPGGGFNPYDHS